MAKFKVFQDADYVQGHLRYGHREGIIEADSKEAAIDKAKEKICADYKTRDILKIYIKEKEFVLKINPF